MAISLEGEDRGFPRMFEIFLVVTELDATSFDTAHFTRRIAISVCIATFGARFGADIDRFTHEFIREARSHEYAARWACFKSINIAIACHFAKIGTGTFDGTECAVPLGEIGGRCCHGVVFRNRAQANASSAFDFGHIVTPRYRRASRNGNPQQIAGVLIGTHTTASSTDPLFFGIGRKRVLLVAISLTVLILRIIIIVAIVIACSHAECQRKCQNSRCSTKPDQIHTLPHKNAKSQSIARTQSAKHPLNANDSKLFTSILSFVWLVYDCVKTHAYTHLYKDAANDFFDDIKGIA